MNILQRIFFQQKQVRGRVHEHSFHLQVNHHFNTKSQDPALHFVT